MRFNKLIPELSVSDFAASLEFYINTLGFTIEYQRPEVKFAFLSLEGSQLMIEQVNHHWETGSLEHPFGRGINFQIAVLSVEPLLKSLKGKNYPVMKGPMDNWYRQGDILLGCREFLVVDPDGYLLRFSQDLGKKKAAVTTEKCTRR